MLKRPALRAEPVTHEFVIHCCCAAAYLYKIWIPTASQLSSMKMRMRFSHIL